MRPLARGFHEPPGWALPQLLSTLGLPLREMVPLLLVLLMSAVPVALPMMFRVGMTVGAMELAKRGVLATRLSAAEDADDGRGFAKNVRDRSEHR